MGGAVFIGVGPKAGIASFFLVLLVAGGGAIFVTEAVGGATGRMLHPSMGRKHRDYSGPASLVARGLYREAVTAYRGASLEFPEDAVPCLGAARVHANHLRETETALQWFREAWRRGLPPGHDRVVIREIVEVAERGGNGLLAARDLAQYAEQRAGTAEGVWARTRLEELREALRDQP